MDDKTALKFVEHLLLLKQAKQLTDTEKAIFCGTWNGLSYEKIAGQIGKQTNVTPNSQDLRHIGSKLWHCINDLWELKPGTVKKTKKRLQGIVEQQWKLTEEQEAQKSQTLPPPIIDASPEKCSLRLREQPSAIAKVKVATASLQDTKSQTTEPDSKLEVAVSNPNFVGRESAIANLHTLVNQGAKVILIHAKGGVGKTTLAQNYLQQRFGLYIEFPIAKETQNITSVESLIEERLKQLGEEPGREFGVSLDRLKRKLQTERIGVLIDNLEPALDGNGKIIEPHRRYVELLTALADPQVQSVTLITSRECIRESAVTVRHYRLEGLDLAAWQEFFNSRLKTPLSPPEVGGGNLAPLLVGGDGGGQIVELSPALIAMHKAYGGNAKAMEILSSDILQEYDGNIEACWQGIQEDLLSLGELEDLVTYQFNRLQQLNPDAYKLLCRMGCYRYQDVPTVPEEGLFCMLWDVPEIQHRRVFKSLRDRSLVEFRNGEYWLHPVIRAEAIDRLKASDHWQATNQEAAKFWTESVKTVETVEDARKAFEAYYHYIENQDLESACSVILNTRDNQWGAYETLGRAFYRLGLFKKMIDSINFLINRNYSTKRAYWSELYNVLGSMYWLTGNLHDAIQCYEVGYQLAVDFKLDNFRLISLLNISLCKLDLWEIEEAIKYFKKYASLAEKYQASEHLKISWFCLAFLNSMFGYQQESYELAEKSYIQPTQTNHAAPWHISYRFLFLAGTYRNLKNIDKSFDMYTRAIAYAQEAHYAQAKAKALTGLAELYRDKEDFQQALSHHSKSIKLLDNIGAKCDLAEAYYQLGLTYQKMRHVENSKENFDKAIQLFSDMEAPKQVEKVEQARDNGG